VTIGQTAREMSKNDVFQYGVRHLEFNKFELERGYNKDIVLSLSDLLREADKKLFLMMMNSDHCVHQVVAPY